MLQTNLKHIVSEEAFYDVINENENVMICCGRMGPMCIPVYAIMKEIEPEYKQVQFHDLEFDGPLGHLIRNLPECKGFMGLPFTVYFKNGQVAAATASIQSIDQVHHILEREFGSKE
ncbi:MAG: thioredoxin [Bacteroidales bacterium]